ncbi:Pls/PosA family non-ribosomal peptide synthetase [Aquirhabdus sp.]|uniref:Pls/PosA family non-ribosomal peptide synthetase n=1 Tax=Aquirhabdus sp. TaxID=2824160 RepID=UPI00396C3B8C
MNSASQENQNNTDHSSIRAIVRGENRPDLLKYEVLADLFEETVSRVPEKIALIFNDENLGPRALTYTELNHQADLVAHHLIQNGVVAGQIVGLWLPRGIELLVAQLGIAKAGAAWLPFDTETPVDRIMVCLEDASAAGLISDTNWLPRLAPVEQPVWTIEALLAPSSDVLSRRQNFLPSHPAYVIYTSGSTGKPKGIVINQGSICHFLRSENAVLGVQESDKVYQGFSTAFDMSFEEIWISYLVGATLWIAPKSLTTDPDALPLALIENQITVLHAVPTLLALFSIDVPNLRIINLGGEMCPDSLVERWALPHHQIFNTYGPTEATVSASLANLHRGQPVTIGKPLPNYGLLVVDDQFNLLNIGETGELCIFGMGVADGYLGRPDLTAEKFLNNPWAQTPEESKLYKTGDLAILDENGQIALLGRADDQIKIRGFRVELGEIEAILTEQAGIGTAAVLLRNEDGMDQLIAFIVPDGSQDHDLQAKTESLSGTHLRAKLREKLPPYMVPNRFEVIEQVPRLLSGKIDRKALRVLPLTTIVDRAASDEPTNPAEVALFGVLNKLFPNAPIQLSADFFDDLGGHSLLAARLVSGLRAFPEYSHITIHDLYQKRRVGAIAEKMAEQSAQQDNIAAWQPEELQDHTARRFFCGLAQIILLPFLISLHILQWLAPFFTYHFLTGSPDDNIWYAISVSLAVFLLTQITGFAVSIFGKRLLLLNIKAGRYPLWGVVYLRWWLADRLSDVAPVHLLSGSSLYHWYLRGMGAKVGRDVSIGSIHVRMPSLVNIGDGVSIGSSVNLENARVERGWLILGSIDLAKESYVGSYAILESDTAIKTYGRLNGLSALSHGQTINEYEVWDGAPAKKVEIFDPASYPPRPAVSNTRLVGEFIFFLASVMVVACLFFIPIFPTFIIVDWFDAHWLSPLLAADNITLTAVHYFILAIPASAVMIIVTALLSVAIRWIALPRLKPGISSVHSETYYRKWFANQIQESSLQILRGVYATVYAPTWYRMLGAKVGRDAEISTAMGVVPDMLTLGDESFIADAVMLGDEEISGGWMILKPTVVGNRSFVGNGAYVPDGTTIPDGVLIGVQSKAPEHAINEGETWFGSPPIRLPAREKMTGFTEGLTFKPTILRRFARGFIEAMRIVLPLALTIGVGYMVVLSVIETTENQGWTAGFAMLILCGLLYGIGCFVFVGLLKWVLIGRYKPKSVPMWTLFVWLSEAVTSLHESVSVPNFLNYLRGTPLLPWMFRLMGTKIGKQVYLDTTDITEYDCVQIGDHVEMNSFCGPQTHLFEDRIMKIGHVIIGDRVSVSARSIILYHAEVGHDAYLGPLTLVMKGEQIPPSSAWTGSPAVPWRKAD